jgi:hypothetical protein
MDKVSKTISQDSMQSLSTELSNLATRIGGSTDRLVGVGNNLITSLEKQSKAQGRHEKAIIALTIVIALAAILSTYTTWLSVKAMREANEIQRRQIQTTNATK